MLNSLLLALSLQAAPEEASGFVLDLPRGWTRQADEASKGTILLPPDGAAHASLLLYPAMPDAPGSPQEIHAKMLAAIGAAAEQSGNTGRFLWSRATMTPPGFPPLRIALYTAKSGTTAGVALFAAPDAAFRKHLPDVERLIGGLRFAGEPAPQAVHGLVLPFPPGWTRKDDPQGAAAFSPPPPRGPLDPSWDYVLIVLPPQPLLGGHWKTHKAVFDDVLRASQLKDVAPVRHSPDEAGPFIRSVSAGRDPAGRIREVSLYSARSEASIECIVISGQEDRDGLRALLGRTTLRNPRKEVERPRIVEAWRRFDTRIRFNGPVSLKYERIWLRSDGVADFTVNYPPGHAVSPEILKYDPDLQDGRVGAWKARGEKEVEIVRTAGVAAELYVREDGRLRHGDQVWQRMPAVDGLRLEGRWGVEDVEIAFTKAGRFQDRGLAHHAAAGDGLAKPPRQGAGSYEIREWTLFLRYDDGAVWSSDFSTIGPDPADQSAILLRTSAFPKRP